MALPDELPPPPASGSVATTACPSDEELLAFALGKLDDARVAVIHAHLDECEVCQRVLSEAAHSPATAVTEPLPESADDDGWVCTFRPGTLVARRYLIQHFIARGGMGEVYEALDRDMQQRIALKTVTSTAGDNPRAVRRLRAEVQLARRVTHANVCRIHDLGTHFVQPGGAQVHFLTMEFVEGETLGQRVRLAGALPIDEVQKVARELVLGLRAAHEAGILHRDFKSDNVILKADADGQSSAVILDFGLARALDGEDQVASSSNPTLVGTFGYIAPEQLEGKPHTPASDVYAFGVVLFEMLTGQLPFESGSSPAINALERLQKRAPAPSSVNPSVPSGFDAVVGRCLRRVPEERYQSAAEVLAALDALRDAPPTTPFHRRPLVLGVAVVAAVAAAYFAIQSLAPAKAPAASETRAPASPERLVEKPAVEPAPDPTMPESRPVAASGNGVPREAARSGGEKGRGVAARESSPEAASGLTKSRPSSAPDAPGAATGSSPAASGAVPVPSATPAAPAPDRSKKPDWENPFGANDRSDLPSADDASET
jgi:serine/threonine protein kinase